MIKVNKYPKNKNIEASYKSLQLVERAFDEVKNHIHSKTSFPL